MKIKCLITTSIISLVPVSAGQLQVSWAWSWTQDWVKAAPGVLLAPVANQDMLFLLRMTETQDGDLNLTSNIQCLCLYYNCSYSIGQSRFLAKPDTKVAGVILPLFWRWVTVYMNESHCYREWRIGTSTSITHRYLKPYEEQGRIWVKAFITYITDSGVFSQISYKPIKRQTVWFKLGKW